MQRSQETGKLVQQLKTQIEKMLKEQNPNLDSNPRKEELIANILRNLRTRVSDPTNLLLFLKDAKMKSVLDFIFKSEILRHSGPELDPARRKNLVDDLNDLSAKLKIKLPKMDPAKFDRFVEDVTSISEKESKTPKPLSVKFTIEEKSEEEKAAEAFLSELCGFSIGGYSPSLGTGVENPEGLTKKVDDEDSSTLGYQTDHTGATETLKERAERRAYIGDAIDDEEEIKEEIERPENRKRYP